MRLLAVGLALVCLLPPSAHAQTKKAAEKIGHITQTQATSACIGGAGSASCATETLLACFARADKSLCEKVGADPRGIRDPAPVEYVIDRVGVIRQEDITEDMRDLEWFKPGYTLVELRRRSCAAPCGDEPWEDMQVYLRQRGSAWEVVNWRAEVEEDEVPETPEDLKPAKPQ
jgi:hypothetical protein